MPRSTECRTKFLATRTMTDSPVCGLFDTKNYKWCTEDFPREKISP
jgi:hypothetical protein